MAELILTEEEKQAPTYIDWSDDTLGKAVRHLSVKLEESFGSEAIIGQTGAQLLIKMAEESNAKHIKVETGGYQVEVTKLGSEDSDE